jgi:hypothetical protein
MAGKLQWMHKRPNIDCLGFVFLDTTPKRDEL